MKKTLEDELMGLAHRILKLSGKEDLEQMKMLTAELYEKLCVLSFAEKHSAVIKPSFNYEEIEQIIEKEEIEENTEEVKVTSKTEKKSKKEEIPTPIKEVKETKIEEKKPTSVSTETETFSEKQEIESIQKHEIPEKPIAEEEISAEEVQETLDSSEIDLREISVHYDDLPQFEPISFDEDPPIIEDDKPEIDEIEESKEEIQEEKIEENIMPNPLGDLFSGHQKQPNRNESITHKRSLNQSLKLGLSFGLNDRLAFIKNLFENNEDDFNRVISQLNSFEKYSEARDFIEQQVKPDYDWENKVVYEERFFQALEKRMDE